MESALVVLAAFSTANRVHFARKCSNIPAMIPLFRAVLAIGALVYFSPARTFPVELPAAETVRLPEKQELSRLGQSLDAAASALAATGWLNAVWDAVRQSWMDLNAGARPDKPAEADAQPASPRIGE